MAEKTNAIRLIQQAKLVYREIFYEFDGSDSIGLHAASTIGIPAEQVFKTLVARGDRNGIQVFCIPACCELDLKKAAKVSNNKKIELVAVKDLLNLTGYIRGGCSPIGMKKQFATVIDETATLFDKIYVSAGVRGMMLGINPDELLDYVGAKFADVTFVE